MKQAEQVVAYIMQQLSVVGSDFGWQMGKVSANYENGYMKCNQDSKAHFRRDKIKKDIEKLLENDFVDSNKMVDHSGYFQNGKDHIGEPNEMVDQFREDTKKVVTNADRIRSMTDEGLAQFLKDCSCYVTCADCSEIDVKGKCTGDCAKPYFKWLKEKVEL